MDIGLQHEPGISSGDDGDPWPQRRAEPLDEGREAAARDESDSDMHGDLPEDEWLAKVLDGKYRIERRLGSGGMGSVYEARHVALDRRVAVKVLHAEYASQPAVLKRFENEAKAAGRLQHPNLVAVIDFGWTEGRTPYIVMEHLPGRDCARLLAAKGPLPAAQAADIAFQACLGLAIAHRAGIVHRDIKPENLFVTAAGDGNDWVKVLDFGIAKLRTASATSVTAAGSTIGTYYYMSPEQVRDSAKVDARTDVWAMGVVLYELLSGRKPFVGDEVLEVVYKVVHSEPVSLRTVRPDLPSGLIDIVDRAMKKAPEHRTPSIEQLGQELAVFAGRSSFAPSAANSVVNAAPKAIAVDPTVPASSTSHAGVFLSASAAGAKALHPRATRLIVAAAALLVLATSLVFYFVTVSPLESQAAGEGLQLHDILAPSGEDLVDGVASPAPKLAAVAERKTPADQRDASIDIAETHVAREGQSAPDSSRPAAVVPNSEARGPTHAEYRRIVPPSNSSGVADAENAGKPEKPARPSRAPRGTGQGDPSSVSVLPSAPATSVDKHSLFDTLY